MFPNRRTRSFIQVSLVPCLSLFVSACGGSQKILPTSAGKEAVSQDSKDRAAQAGTGANDEQAASGAEQDSSQRTVAGVGFQVKNKLLLASSIDSCVGPGQTRIADNMILRAANQRNGAAPAAGTKQFISRGRAGDNAVELQGANLYDPTLADRLDTASNSLTVTYLQAADVVANVVAQNCNPQQNALCKCDTPEAAHEFLKRCLPQFSEAEVSGMANDFAAKCKASTDSYRSTLAAFFSSGAFVQAK